MNQLLMTIARIATSLHWGLVFAPAMACSSFAGLFDTPPWPAGGEDAGASSGPRSPAANPRPSLPGGDRPVGQTPGALPRPVPVRPAGDSLDPEGNDGPTSEPFPAVDAGPLAPEPGSLPCMGSALSLDGASFALIPRVIEDDFTIEAWIATTTSRSGNSGFYGRAVFDADIAGMGQNDDFSTSVLNDRFAFAVGNPDTTIQGITPVTTGEWTHVAVTRRRSTGELNIFVNGVLDAVTVAPNRAALAGAMTISFGGSVLERQFVGLIDEVKIWNIVREGATIAATMRVLPAASEPGLVGYYSFEDRGASETADGSPLGGSAALMGSPAYAPSSVLCPQPN